MPPGMAARHWRQGAIRTQRVAQRHAYFSYPL